MKIGYYPGCSLHSTAIEYDMSTRAVCAGLGVDLAEIKDWICCGSSPAHQCDELMSVALPVKNMVLAKQQSGLSDICAPCASCYSRLKFAQAKMSDEKTREQVEHVIEDKYPQGIEVSHLLDVIVDKVGIEAAGEKKVKDLGGMKVACYYGCLMTRPPKITGKGDYENPKAMESLLEAFGADGIDWNLKTFCCGASFALTQTDVVLELTKKILYDACRAGADAIAVGCPLCHANLDGRQQQLNDKFDTNFKVPVFYFTQLMGLAMGIDPAKLGVLKHITPVDEFLKERELL